MSRTVKKVLMDGRAARSIRRGEPQSTGFTLLEILLALGLSVVLLVAVAAAIDLYRRMTVAGQDQVSEARLVRAVLRKMENDLHSVVPPQTQVTSPYDSASSGGTGASGPGSSSSSGSGGSSSKSSSQSSSGSSSSSSSSSSSGSSSSSTSSTGTTTQSQTTATMDPLQNVYAQTVFGLLGDQKSLMLNTLCAHRSTDVESAPNTAQPLSAIHGDMKTVGYFFTTTGQASPGAATSGLARLEGDHVAIGYAMQQSASALTSGARVIAPEVASIGFRYFDGTQWLTTWDASYLQALPAAVEITITVRVSDPNGTTAAATVATPTETRQYRHVVAISTMAQPMPINELATIPTGTTP